MATKTAELANECKRQFENCLYSASSFLIWLRWLRLFKGTLIVAPTVLGAFASAKLLVQSDDATVRAFAAIASLLGGVLSSVYSALKLDARIAEFQNASGELTNLRDAFRYAALVSSKKPFDEFEAEVAKLRTRLDKVRGQALTAPECCFKAAQAKISAGDYRFDLDTDSSESPPAVGGPIPPPETPRA